MSDIGRFSTFSPFARPDRETAMRADVDDAPLDQGLGDDRPGSTTSNTADLASRFTALMRARTDDPADAAAAGDGDAETANRDAGVTTADDRARQGDDGLAGAMMLLASAGTPAGGQSPYAFVVAAEAGRGVAGDATAERILRMVDQALRAEFAPVAGKPIEIALDLSAMVPGLDGLTVSMAAGSIDVVLRRSADEAGREALRISAGGLAETLRQRFGKRIVRIWESGGPAGASAGDATGETTA